MDIKIGSTVETTDGKTGHIQRIVMDPSTRQITHLVLRLGWLAPRDVVIPIRSVEEWDESRIALNIDRDQLEHMPDFIERHFVSPADDWEWPEGYPDETVLSLTTPSMVSGSEVNVYGAEYEPLMIEEDQNIPVGSAVIEEGMKVFADGRDVGEVTEVEFDHATDRVTSIVVKSSEIGGSRKVPAERIVDIKEGEVHLALSATELESLPEAES